ncbi:MAG TPA: hypothetical protein VE548_01350 [Nitrososphaeraceae archaeon]|nr:hypothetical protein [Nitrososphaeraceae archaeon]
MMKKGFGQKFLLSISLTLLYPIYYSSVILGQESTSPSIIAFVKASVVTTAYGQSEDHGCRGPEDAYNKCMEEFSNNRTAIRVGTA